MSSTNINTWVEQHRRQLQRGLFLQRAADWLIVFCFVFGLLVLGVKLFYPALWPYALWLLIVLVPVLLLVRRQIRHRAWTAAETVSLLDQRLQADGLIITLQETGDTAWTEQLNQRIPDWRQRWLFLRPLRFARLLLVPLAFAIGACFVPLRQTPAEPLVPKAVGEQATARLQQSLDWLDEAHVLTPEESEELREEVDKLTNELDHTPLTHEKWEAIDSLRRTMEQRLESARRSVAAGQRAASRLAQATKPGAEGVSPDREETLGDELIETLQKRGERGAFSKSTPGLQNELQRLVQEQKLPNQLSNAERQQMLDRLQEFLDDEADKLAELQKQLGTLQPGGSGQLGQPGENGGMTGLQRGQNGEGMQQGSMFGQGRGGGPADLTWGKESDEKQAKFKQVVLPPGFLDEPGEDVVDVTRAAPNVAPGAIAPRNRARNTDAATGQETRARALRPRHRAVIRQYFDDE